MPQPAIHARAPKIGKNRGNAGKGRPKGARNKSTASVKAALAEAFEKRGGVPSLLTWAESEPTEFYRLWSKMIPAEVEMSGKGGGPLIVSVRIEREGKRATAS